MKEASLHQSPREGRLAASFSPSLAIAATWGVAFFWSCLLAFSYLWNFERTKEETLRMAYAEARAVRDKDMAFRRWGLKHQGVYVPVTEKEGPSPYLRHVPRYVIETVAGQKLALRAPATMVREMMDDYVEQGGGVRGRIVGLRALNPANLPDDWEKAQLEAFEKGQKTEVWEIADLDGKPHLRYLKAWHMEEGCVECHGVLGYQVGDMRGATGVNLPLAPYYAHIDDVAFNLVLSHGGIWLIGLMGIGLSGRQAVLRARERMAVIAEIQHLARHDSLTGLDNRYSLMSRLEQALATARRERQKLALMLIDMDRFKNINDTLGHHIGDGLLVEVARRLTHGVRESDIVARLGGDEFVVALTGIAGPEDALAVGSKLLAALAEPYRVEGHLLHSTPSIGVALFPDNAEEAVGLLKDADAAMYQAKAQGRNRLVFFTPELALAAAERLELERELRHALATKSLTVVYQPQVEAMSGRIVAFEALARWPHPTRGWIPPSEFVPVAEESGLIESLGEWVLEEACRQLARWRKAGIHDVRIAVNLSAHHLRSAQLASRIAAILHKHETPPGMLEIEITESAAMADPEHAIEQLRRLRHHGVKIAIDDFGTGYSSLAYLKRLPIDALKIDRAFVADLEHDVNDAMICRATVALAKSLRLAVIAEGVETAAQRDFLAAIGCDCLQGYHFGRPAPAETFMAVLQAR
ncbi:MAG: EAL domain-containing protein [Rhodocyclaceae bacterium]|nr:EAL domain-containing protein [Rhodocyclaceae bacterium]